MIGSGASPLSRWRAAARNLTRLTEAKILNRSSAQAAIIFAGAARLIVGGAFAVPFTPNDDNQVLERLPPTSAVIGIELRAMSAEIANSPDKQEEDVQTGPKIRQTRTGRIRSALLRLRRRPAGAVVESASAAAHCFVAARDDQAKST